MSASKHADNDTPAPKYVRRPFIGVRFDCCGIFSRIYRRMDQREYRGCCPRCLREVVIPVGENGTAARMFCAK